MFASTLMSSPSAARLVSSLIVRRRGGAIVSSSASTIPNIINASTSSCSCRFSSTNEEPVDTKKYQYAVVEHSEAYFDNMSDRHGKQLSLAYNEGSEKEEKYLPDDFLDRFSALETSEGENTEEIQKAELVNDEEADIEDEDEEGDELEEILAKYNNDGSVKMDPKELAAYKAGAPAGGMFAIIRLDGSQHKVTVDDVVVMNKLKPVTKWKVGETLTLNPEEVLLVGSQERTLVGLPGISGAVVKVMVEEITHDATVIVFKKRRRKNSRRKNGFRREVTILRVLDIQMPDRFQKVENERKVA